MVASLVSCGVLWRERHPCTFTEQHVPWGVPWGDGQWVTVCLYACRCVSCIFSPSPSTAAAHVPGSGRSGWTTPHPPPPPPPGGMCAATCTSRETCASGNSSPSRSSSLGSGKTGESTALREKTIPTVSSEHVQFIQSHVGNDGLIFFLLKRLIVFKVWSKCTFKMIECGLHLPVLII